MFYVYWEESKVTTLDILNKCKGWKGNVVVDSTGTKYAVKRSYMTGWKGIHGFTGVRTGMISFEIEYEDNPTHRQIRMDHHDYYLWDNMCGLPFGFRRMTLRDKQRIEYT